MMQKLIDTLIQIEPRFQQALAATGYPNYRARPTGFTYLYQTIVSQQLSTATADSIWQRLESANLITASAVLAASEVDLRACRLSKQD